MAEINGVIAYQVEDCKDLAGQKDNIVECFFIENGNGRTFHIYNDVTTASGDITILYLAEKGTTPVVCASIGSDEAYGEGFRCPVCDNTRLHKGAKFCSICGVPVKLEGE